MLVCPEAIVSPLLNEQRGAMIGCYKLVEEIGAGGFGVVYLAEQEQPLRRQVALKILKRGMDTKDIIGRFEAERQALALMDHPNIAKVFDAGATPDGRPYFVMELVKGERITDYCDKHHLTTQQRLDLFVKICHAIQHAHQKGIIHRDIKPSNILVSQHDGAPQPKVIDFGIAKATQQRLTDKTIFTALGAFIGTPAYMSPEQADNTSVDIDTRSDIYSLGVVLYELLTGKTPFDLRELLANGIAEMRRAIREDEPRRPSMRLTTMGKGELTTTAKHRQTDAPKLVQLVRGDLDWIVMKCLEKDRTRRYETANGLAADLLRHLNNEPVLARPPSTAYRIQKAWRRHKTAFAAAALIAVVLVAATCVSVWQAILAKDRLADSEAISKFLIELFQSPDPARDGRTITVAETLGAAVKKLDKDLAGQPARRSKLQATLGTTYHALGLTHEAIALQEKARDYDLAALGPANPETLKDTANLANSYDAVDRRGEALKLREQVLALRRKVSGPEHPDTLKAMNNLALSYYQAGRRDEALKLIEEVLALRRRVLGPEHPDTLSSMLNLAVSYSSAGRGGEAIKLQEEALALQRKVKGPEDPDTLKATSNLGHFYELAGRREEALKLWEQVLPLSRKVVGPEHPDTIAAMDNLAFSYDEVGRRDDALKMREETVALRRRVIGPADPGTLEDMFNLANSYGQAGRTNEALKLREEVLALRLKVSGLENLETLSVMNNLSVSYNQAGRTDDAVRLLEQVLAVCRKMLGPEHPVTVKAMNNLAFIYDDAGRREEYVKLLEDALAIRRKVNGPQHPDTLASMKNLAFAYCSAGRSEEAIALVKKVRETDPKDTDASITLATWQAWFGRDADYEATRHLLVLQAQGTDQAQAADGAVTACCLRPSTDAALLANTLNLARRAVELGKGTPALPGYQLDLAIAQYRNDQYTAAELGVTIAEQTAGDNVDIQGIARMFHAMTLFRQNQPEEARKAFRQAQAQMPALPKEESKPIVDGRPLSNPVLMWWLACKEARSMLKEPAAAEP